MYIDNYEIVTLGNKYEGNKTKKNQVLTHMHVMMVFKQKIY